MKVLAKKAGAKKRIDLKNATTREILSFSLLPFGLLTIVNVIGNALNVYLADYLGIGMVGAGLVLSVTKIWDAKIGRAHV